MRGPGRTAAVAVLALLASPLSVLAQSPSGAPAPTVPEVELSPDAAYATWFQIEHGTGGDVLWVGRVGGRAEDVVRVAGSVGAAAVTSASEGTEVLAWWPAGLGGVVRRFGGDGSILPLLETGAPVAAAAASGDGRWVIWATAADDGSVSGVRRRHINRHANQDIGRLAGALDVTGIRLFSDHRANAVVIAGADPAGATTAWLLAPDADAQAIPVPPDGIAIGLMEQTLVVGTPAGDGTAGPPFTFVELPSMVATVRDVGPGSHAVLTRDGWLAWEAAGADGAPTVMTMGTPGAGPAVAWSLDPTATGGDRHLVGATADAGYGGERWVALYPDGLPFQGPDADPVADGGTFVQLPGPGVAITAAILPPVREGQPWFPIMASEQPIAIEAATHVSDGWLAVGRTDDGQALRLWHSTDGRSWRARRSPIPVGTQIGTLHIYSRGRNVILAGGEMSEGPNRVHIWTSRDAGNSWTTVPSGPMLGAGPVGRSELSYANASVRGIGRLGDRYAIVGMFCVESCQRPTLWTSRDLRTWSRTPLRPRVGDRTRDHVTDVIVGRGRLVATFWPDETIGPGTRLAASTDGRRWSDLGTTPDTSGFLEVVDARGGLTVVGKVGDDGPLAIWHSRDGRSWEQVYQDASAWGVDDVAVSGGWSPSMVLIGTAELEPGGDDRQNATLVSIDGGPWERSVGWMTPTNSRPAVAVFGGSEVVVLGSSDGGGNPAGWRTELMTPRSPIGTP